MVKCWWSGIEVLILLVTSIFIFLNGFLLTRTSLDHKFSPNGAQFHSNASAQPVNVVIVLIDAFSYDFIPKMPFISQMVSSSGIQGKTNTVSFRFIADAPTTTLQRIKGLTTGQLPTFVEVSSNFAGSEVLEDTWLHQALNSSQYSIRFFGDDTWNALFSTSFFHNESVFYPSFNVKDLDTVDNGVIQGFKAVLPFPSDESVILIGHMLGVDHCGHTFGRNHPRMSQKLLQVDQFVKDVYSQLNDNTILFVFGDHGMTSSGDHGGDTEAEVNAAFVAMSKRGWYTYPGPSAAHFQTDFVPTLAYLLGFPIPFSSIGIVIPELLVYPSYGDTLDEDELTRRVQSPIDANVKQIFEYLQTYSTFAGWQMPMDEVRQLERKVESLRGSSPHHLRRFVSRELRQFLVDKFNSFDLFVSVEALFSMLMVICMSFHMPETTWQSVGLSTFVSFVVVSFGFIWKVFASVWPLLFALYCTTKARKSIANMLMFVLSNKSTCFWILLTSVMLSVYKFSNSFLIDEGRLMLFLLQTLILLGGSYMIICYPLLKAHDNEPGGRTLLFLSLITLQGTLRLLYGFGRCREEQILYTRGGCEELHWTSPLYGVTPPPTNLQKNWRFLLSTASIFLAAKLTGLGTHSRGAQRCLYATAACIVATWLMESHPQMLSNDKAWMKIWSARMAGICAIVSILLHRLFPPVDDKRHTRSLAPGMILMLVSLLLFDGYAVALGVAALGLVVIPLSSGLVQCVSRMALRMWGSANTEFIASLAIYLLNSFAFYACGGHLSFATLRFHSSYIGQYYTNEVVVPFLLTLITAYGSILLVVAAFVPVILTEAVLAKRMLVWSPPCFAAAGHTLYVSLMRWQTLDVLASCVACIWLRRHLMMWKIFAPAMMFKLTQLAVTAIAALFGYLQCH